MNRNLNRRTFINSAMAAGAATGVAAARGGSSAIRILGGSGSLRKGKTCGQALQVALAAAKAVNPAIETEIIELAGMILEAPRAFHSAPVR